MTFYRRRLPHVSVVGDPVFLTWRLHGSLPPDRFFPTGVLSSGEAFAALDRLLDEAHTGPFYLRQPTLADMVVRAIHYNSAVLGHYDLHAYVVMPNHVRMLATPAVPLPKLTKSLKGITAKRANSELRHRGEFEKVRRYIEWNPVRAGPVTEASQYHWSSAGWETATKTVGRAPSLAADPPGPPQPNQGVRRGPGGPPHGYNGTVLTSWSAE